MRNLAWAIIVAGAASAVAQVPPGGGGAGGAGGVPGAGQVPPRTPPPAAGKGQGVGKREQTPPKGAGAGVAPSGIRMKGTAPIPPPNETPEQRRARLLREAKFGTTQPGAQPGAAAPGTMTNPTVDSRSNQIMSFDANGDGRVSQAELTLARFSPIFTQADANSDGFVTSAELSQLFTANPNLLRDPIWLDRSKAGRAAMKNLTAGARSGPDFVSNFMTYDADGDGRLQRSEITAPALGALFTRVDANADGVVSTAEL
ncbi:MAG TPA: hypothetical protein VNC50_03040, partial [Planctomycetia bacterium]|nr:hypothetical protein [Planctomycetia bacterium]